MRSSSSEDIYLSLAKYILAALRKNVCPSSAKHETVYYREIRGEKKGKRVGN